MESDEMDTLEPSSSLLQETPAAKREKALVVAVCFWFFWSFVFSSIYAKKVAIILLFSPFALAVLTALVGTVVYPLFLFPLWTAGAFTRRHAGDAKCLLWAFLVGSLFSSSNVLFELGNRGNIVPGGIVLLISKLVVPCSMLFEVSPCIGRWFSKVQYFGVFLLLSGIGVTLYGQFAGSPAPSFVLNIVLLVISVVPLAAGGIIIQEVVQKRYPDLNVIYFWWIISVSEIPILPLLSFLNMYVQDLSPSQIIPNLLEGLVCAVFGTSERYPVCSEGPSTFLFSLLFGIGYNICIPWIIRHLRATWVWILRTAALPVSSLLFCVEGIMGNQTTPFSPWMVGGLITVVIALLIFSAQEIWDLIKQAKQKQIQST